MGIRYVFFASRDPTAGRVFPKRHQSIQDVLSQFNQAITTFFDVRSTEQARREADKYLQHFQQTQAAWEISNNLLNNPQLSPDILHFAAITLHDKISYDFDELPAEAQAPLRDSIANHLLNWGLTPGAPRPLLKRLCLCAAALAVQMNWQQVLDSVPALIQKAPPGHEVAVTRVALDMLACLPDECNSRTVHVSDQARQVFQLGLDGNAPQVLDFLSTTFSRPEIASNVDAMDSLLACLGKWVRFCIVSSSSLAAHPVLGAAFEALLHPSDLFEVAVDLMVDIFRAFSAEEAHMELVQVMVPRVMSLRGRFEAASRAGEEELDELRGLCRVFTEMAEAYIDLLVSPMELNQLAVLELILLCTSSRDHKTASIPLWFWYKLVRQWGDMPENPHKASLHTKFGPVIVNLVHQCLRLLQYPSDFDPECADEREDFEALRQEVAETVSDCCLFLGCDNVVSIICERLGTNEYAALQNGEWRGVEAGLYSLRSVNREFSLTNDNVLNSLCEMVISLEQMPVWSSAPKLRSTSCSLVAGLSDWLSSHPDPLPPLFTFLYNNLTCPDTSVNGPAATGIQRLCEKCAPHLGEPVLGLYDQLVGFPAGHLEKRDELKVYEGLGRVVNSLAFEVAERSIGRMVTPLAERLAVSAQKASAGDRSAYSATVAHDLEVLGALAKPLTMAAPAGAAHPMVTALGTVWNTLDVLLKIYGGHENMVEKICRFYKHTMRAARLQFAPFLQTMIDHLLLHYSQNPLSAFLYTGSICITEFGGHDTYDQLLFDMLVKFSESTFRILKDIEAFTNSPSLVEEYFFLVSRYLEYCPILLLSSPLVASVIECGVVGLQLDHREAQAGVVSCFETLIRCGIENRIESGDPGRFQQQKEATNQVLSTHGLVLVNGLVKTLASENPLYGLDEKKGNPAGVLWRLALLSPETTSSLLIESLKQVPLEVVPQNERELLLQDLQRCVASEDRSRFFRSVSDFHATAKRNIRRLARQQKR